MRISDFHNVLKLSGEIPSEKVQHNKGIRRRWKESRRLHTPQGRRITKIA